MTRNKLRLPVLIAIFAGIALMACLPPRLTAQSAPSCSLTVRVTGTRNSAGNLRVTLRRDEKTVIETREIHIDAKTMTAQTVFDGLAEGTYGVGVIHDENKNGKLDMNEVGMPLEGYGHSNNPAKRMGPPSFDETKISVTPAGTLTEIQLIYWP